MLNPTGHAPKTEGSLTRLYFALSIASLGAYVLASEGLRNLFLVTIPQLVAKVSQS